MQAKLFCTIGLGTLCALTLFNTGLAQDDDNAFRSSEGRFEGRELSRKTSPMPFAGQHRGRHQRPRGGLQRLDADEDRRISEEEFIDGYIATLDRLFDRHDQNGDGLLSLEELQPASSRQGRRSIAPDAVSACLQDGNAAAFPARGPDLSTRFDDIDSNGDSFLSHEELGTALQADASERFALADADGDGHLTRKELRAGMNARREDARAARNCMRAAVNR